MSRSSTGEARDSDRTPRPRRRWMLLAILLVIIAIPVSHALWREHEWRKLHAMMDRYRAMGEPVLPEDFNPRDVDAPGNPATALVGAGAAVWLPGGQKPQDVFDVKLPFTPAEVEHLGPALEKNAAVLARMDAATQRQGPVVWPVQFASPTMTVLMPELNAQRNLARLLRAAALDAHRRGDDAEAAERVHQIMFQAHALYAHPSLIAHLVALGIQNLGAATAREIAPDLEIGRAANGHRAATPEQLRQLVDDLLDERAFRNGQRLALLSERMFEVDTAEAMAAGTLDPTTAGMPSPGRPFLGYVLGPIIYKDAGLLFERCTRLVPVAQADNWQTCETHFQAIPDKRSYGRGHIALQILEPAMHRALLQGFRAITDSRLSAVVVASWWYAAEHEGRLPTDLDQLVPRYLPAVPSDPMAAGALLKYRADPKDPIAYSVGDDGHDDGASTRPAVTRTQPQPWDLQDYVIHVKRQPREQPDDVSDEQETEPAESQPAATQPEMAPATETS